MACRVSTVSLTVSPFTAEECRTSRSITSAESRLAATSNEEWVRVLGS